MPKEAYQLTVIGRVQQVGYRYACNKIAKSLGVFGYVKNLNNGNVFIEVEGETSAVTSFINWNKKGPDWAKVIDLKVNPIPIQNFSQFEIRR